MSGDASTAPPWAPRDFDRVAVTTTCSAPAARPRDESATEGADDPEGMGLVDDEERADLGGEGDEVLDGGGVAEHRVDGLGDHDGARAVPPGEQVGDVVEVVVAGHGDRGPGQSAAVDEAGMGVLVADDEGARVRERGQGREVGRVPGREDQGGRGSGEGGEGCLELFVDVQRAGHEA